MPSFAPPDTSTATSSPAARPLIDPDRDHDAIVIGSGSGGLTAAVGLARFGRRVLLLERGQVGGDCTNVGCIPSKSLLHLAGLPRDAAVPVSHPDGTSSPTADRSPAMLARVRHRRDHLRDHEEVEFGSMDGIDLRFGHARLMGATTVAVTQPDGSVVTVTARDVVVATGSRPRTVPVPGLPEDRMLTNENLFELERAPRRMVIVGAGAVGLEMADAFTRMGTDVVVLEAADQVLPGLVPAAARVAEASLRDRGIDLRPGLVAQSWDPASNGVRIGPAEGVTTATIEDVDHVLVAVGRTPNTADLGLDEAGVILAEDGRIRVDHRGRTSAPHVWAIGDVATTGGTTHAANARGRRVVQSIVAPLLPTGRRPLEPAVVFTDPEIASIGHQPPRVPDDVRRLTVELTELDRAWTDEVDHGIMLVDVRKFTGRIVGATIVGPRAGELIATVGLLMQADVGLHRLVHMVMPYPTWSEAFRALEDEWMAIALPQVHRDFASWARARLTPARRRDRAGLTS